MAEIARRTTNNGKRVMFLIHRKEVLQQAVRTFDKQDVNLDLLTAGMVQTLTRRVDKLPTPNVILVDEAHHALAKSYQRILDKFPKAIVLLFTATPHRTGRVQLDQIADDIIVGQSIHELTEQGFLAPFRYFQPPGDFDSKLLKRGSTGDFTNDSMQQAMSTKIFGHIVKQYKRIAPGMQAVVYTYSIDSAIKIAAEFNSEGISAVEVDGTTSKEKRAVAVRKFRDQKIKILVNVNLFTEGVDLPNVDCVIMARPTASLALYLQFSMRCLNPRPGKTAIIVDHANNFKSFGYPDDDRDWKQAIKSGKQKSKTLLKDPGLSIVTCDYCFAVVKASEVKDGKCPICGKPIKVHEAKPISDVDLVEATKARKQLVKKILHDNVYQNVINKKVNELHTMAELQAYAKIHGYKPGWAFFQAKRKGILKK
ncbi:DEAD/DEAH box helicase [Lactobacillus crispatus]|uniref:DEAD/DEAH box helicase n=1 Tax=Lactobacillus crispatus TaxID=47770 RepID=UPI000B5D9FBE|nr:DEAD/DEAH box helicase [Lactobacillus crispatus]OXC12298.1 DEAD/DEAH box helicase [Lactobacillus crispatus]